MIRQPIAALLAVALIASPIDAGPSIAGLNGAAPSPLWRVASALAQEADPSAKEAFEAAKELGTAEAWTAFLARYPAGFYADLARAYLSRLAGGGGTTPVPPAATGAPTTPAVEAKPAAPVESAAAPVETGVPPTDPTKPAIARGASYMGFPERFNRYYTDPAWKPSKTVFVSPNGRGDGASRQTPMAAKAAIDAAKPGTQITFLRGAYQGCFELTKENGGSYDEPVVLYGERNPDKSIGVKMTCCASGRQTCFNLEDADYVAVDGFELVGGQYGVRAVGLGFPASGHSRGVAVIDCNGHDQERDPFKSAQSDWAVWERNVGSAAGKGDGHGIYISGGSDWNIVRFNETFGGVSSDFQINADPNSNCKADGVAFADPRCDSYAGEGEGGRGASDYILVDGNYFHHSLGQGANFTSVRRSVIRNNIFGPQARHNVSFWQETDNPKLGTSENKILHNLFITTGRHGVKFENNSTRNLFANNVILGVKVEGGAAKANPAALLMEVDDTVGDNIYQGNLYVSGKLEGRTPGPEETAQPDFLPAWFAKFPTGLSRDPGDYSPVAGAPFLGIGSLAPDAPSDRGGAVREGKVDLGPIKGP